ncbi:MAG: HAD family hydrolase [Oscillospiraceae bacterium]|nr:HAD family hydrolase [Oscillospiraceae bacterium]
MGNELSPAAERQGPEKFIKQPVRGIFLDIGWTMCRPKSGHWFFTEKFYERAGIDAWNAIKEKRREAAYLKGYNFLDDDHNVKDIATELKQFTEFYGIIADELPELGLSANAVNEIACDHVYNDGNQIFYDDIPRVLEELQKKFKLGIISDTWPSEERTLKEAGLTGYFTSITFSCFLGIWKPHPGMYRHALDSIGLTAGETIFVDDWPANLDGAAEAGIQPVLITRGREKPTGHERFLAVDTLDELCGLL